MAQPVWISSEFSVSAILGLALPLFVINMASQYLPGLAMIRSYGYQPHVNQLIGFTERWSHLFEQLKAYL